MDNKAINPVVGVIVGVVVLLIVLGLGYKFFLAPPTLPNPADHPPRPGYTSYPGAAAPRGAPAGAAAAPTSP